MTMTHRHGLVMMLVLGAGLGPASASYCYDTCQGQQVCLDKTCVCSDWRMTGLQCDQPFALSPEFLTGRALAGISILLLAASAAAWWRREQSVVLQSSSELRLDRSNSIWYIIIAHVVLSIVYVAGDPLSGSGTTSIVVGGVLQTFPFLLPGGFIVLVLHRLGGPMATTTQRVIRWRTALNLMYLLVVASPILMLALVGDHYSETDDNGNDDDSDEGAVSRVMSDRRTWTWQRILTAISVLQAMLIAVLATYAVVDPLEAAPVTNQGGRRRTITSARPPRRLRSFTAVMEQPHLMEHRAAMFSLLRSYQGMSRMCIVLFWLILSIPAHSVAVFWAAGAFLPPAMMNLLFASLMLRRGLYLKQNSSVFTAVSSGTTDAMTEKKLMQRGSMFSAPGQRLEQVTETIEEASDTNQLRSARKPRRPRPVAEVGEPLPGQTVPTPAARTASDPTLAFAPRPPSMMAVAEVAAGAKEEQIQMVNDASHINVLAPGGRARAPNLTSSVATLGLPDDLNRTDSGVSFPSSDS